MRPLSAHSGRSLPIVAVTVAVAYYAGAVVGLALTFAPATTSILWPPNAILTVALLLMPVRWWWVILAAALPAHMLLEVRAGFPPLLLSALYVTNCSEALIAAGGVRLLSDAPTRFDTFRRVAAFIGCAALAAPILSSFADAAVAHWMSDQPYWTVWRMRTFANVLTELSIVPLFVIVASGAPLAPRKRSVEATLLTLGLTATAVWVFGDSQQFGGALAIPQTPPVLMLPFFFWAAVRFGVMGVSAALLIVAAVLSYEAGSGHQPFSPLDPTSGVIAAQLYLSLVGMPLMLVAGLLEERRQGAADLAARLGFESLLSTIAAACVRFTNDPVPPMIDSSLRPIGEFLDCEYVGLLELDVHDALRVSGKWYLPSADSLGRLDCPSAFPWTYEQVLAGHLLVCDSIDRVPVEAFKDRQMFRDTAMQSAIVIPLESGGRVHGALSIVSLRERRWTAEDLTQVTLVAEVLANACARRRSDWQLQEARHGLAHVSRRSSMGELTASLAHQLNQPLAGILTNAQAARHMLDSGSPDLNEISEVIDDIISDDRRAADVIRRVRDMLTPGETQLSRMDVNVLVDDVSKLVASDALLRNVSIAFMLAPGNLAVTGNRVDLEQVVLNILTNAIDAVAIGPANGRVVTVKTLRADGHVQILVRDRGPGLPAGAEHRVFEPFFSTKKSGMGMGLAVARSLVEQAGGWIRAGNDETGGAVVTVSLPSALA